MATGNPNCIRTHRMAFYYPSQLISTPLMIPKAFLRTQQSFAHTAQTTPSPAGEGLEFLSLNPALKAAFDILVWMADDLALSTTSCLFPFPRKPLIEIRDFRFAQNMKESRVPHQSRVHR
jgi:hypothetical protein